MGHLYSDHKNRSNVSLRRNNELKTKKTLLYSHYGLDISSCYLYRPIHSSSCHYIYRSNNQRRPSRNFETGDLNNHINIFVYVLDHLHYYALNPSQASNEVI